MNDPYNTGTEKYSTAQSILDALEELTQTEEMGILSEIGIDVSYEGQTYYYTENGLKLLEKVQEYFDDEQDWLLDLAIYQLGTDEEVHYWVDRCLHNDDIAKRLDFKKLMTEELLKGRKDWYAAAAEKWVEELEDMDFFSNYEMIKSFNRTLAACNLTDLFGPITPYPSFAGALHYKISKLKLNDEIRLVVDARALLTSYDDFLRGMRANQVLFEEQKKNYETKVLQLQASYEAKTRMLLQVAEKAGLLPQLKEHMKLFMIEGAGGVNNESEEIVNE